MSQPEDVDVNEILFRPTRQELYRRLVHISGIGADPASPSPYVRARAIGEHYVREFFPEPTRRSRVLRPARRRRRAVAALTPIAQRIDQQGKRR